MFELRIGLVYAYDQFSTLFSSETERLVKKLYSTFSVYFYT